MSGFLVLGFAVLVAHPAAAQSNEAEMEQEVAETVLDDDQVMFILRSDHPNIVDVEFYSQDRDRAWPGGGKVYSIKDDDWHSYVLSCEIGEDICYGAGVRGDYDSYWGIGIDERSDCERCCITCGGAMSNWITLRE